MSRNRNLSRWTISNEDGTTEDKAVEHDVNSKSWFDSADEEAAKEVEEASGAPEEVNVKASTEDGEVEEVVDLGGPEEPEVIAEEISDSAADLDQVDTMTTAMECYADILTSATRGGKAADKHTLQAIMVGMESFGVPVIMKTMPSVESFHKGGYQVSVEVLDSLKAGIKKGTKAAADIIRHLFQVLEELWHRFFNDTDDLKAKIEALASKASAAKGNGGGKLEVKGGDRVQVNGKFNPGAPGIDALAKVADAMFNGYPECVKAAANTLVSGKIPEGDIFEASKMKLTKRDSGLFSDKLPGNRELRINGRGLDTKVEFVKLGQGATENFSVPDKRQVTDALDELKALVAVLAKHKSDNKFDGVKETLKKVKAPEKGEENNGLREAITKVAKLATAPTGQFIGYLFATVKAYISVYTAFVGALEKGKEGGNATLAIGHDKKEPGKGVARR